MRTPKIGDFRARGEGFLLISQITKTRALCKVPDVRMPTFVTLPSPDFAASEISIASGIFLRKCTSCTRREDTPSNNVAVLWLGPKF